MIFHPDRELSFYADEGLAPDRVSDVAAHLAACARCGRRVEELRAVRRLLAASPAPRPARSLVPRLTVSSAPVWLRPLRSLVSIGAGVFLFLFLATAVLQSGSNLGGGTTAAERAAARGQLSAPTAADKATPGGLPAAGQTAPAVALGSPAAEPHPASGRELGPPPWLFAALAACSAVAALVAHRRLRRS